MNRLSHQLAHDGHATFKQKCRSLILSSFGHEGVLEKTILSPKNGHCDIFEIDIYRIGRIPASALAKRKLFNPLKWVELALVFPFEILHWWIQKSPYMLDKRYPFARHKTHRNRLIQAYAILSHFVLMPASILISNITLAIPRRILAPARYIIRPSIELAKQKPWLFALTLAITTATIAITAALLFTGAVPLALPALTLTAVLITKACITAGVAATMWCGLGKLIQTIADIKQAYAQRKHPERQSALDNAKESTTIISEAFQGMNTSLTRITTPDKQKCAETLALWTGTEAIFFPKKIAALETNNSKSVGATTDHHCRFRS